jgi:putative DNA primase/helicase
MKLDEAKQYLENVHQYFPFDERGYLIHIGCCVSLVCNRFCLLPQKAERINFAYNATSSGLGKTLLTKIASIIASGDAQIRNWPVDDHERIDQKELIKHFNAAAQNAEPFLIFDNCKGAIASQILESFMTCNVWTGRFSSSHKTFQVEHSTIIVLNGNNLSLSNDLQRRLLVCNLDAKDEYNHLVSIHKPINSKWIIDNRARLLSAVLALIENWLDLGQPNSSKIIAGNDTHIHIISGILEAAGLGSLC